MMKPAGFIRAALCAALVAHTAMADSIRVDGKVYTDVRITQTASRYYFRTPDGQPMSVAKDRIGPEDIAFGNEPLREPAPVMKESAPALASPMPVHDSAPQAEEATAPAPGDETPAEPAAPEAEAMPAPDVNPAPEPDVTPEPIAEPEPAPATAAAPKEEAPVAMTEPTPEPAPEPAAEEPAPAEAPAQMTESPALAAEPAAEAATEETAAEAPVEEAPAMPAMPEPVVGTVSAGAARVVDGANPDPLTNFEVNALVIGVGEQRAAFCSADVPVVDRAVHEAVAVKLGAAGSKVNPDAILIAATGVHTGWKQGTVKGVLAESLFGKFDEASFNGLADAIVQAILSAEGALAPAEYVVAETEAPDFQKTREFGSTTLDSTLGVLLVQTHGGEPLGALVNYAIQPPFDVGREAVKSRGIPGSIAQELRARTKEDLPVLFINGAAEDMEPNLGDTPEAQKEASGRIAQLALDALKGATPKRESSFAAATFDVEMPPTLLGDVLRQTALVTELHLSGDRFISLPGLPAAQIGMLLRVKALEQGAGQTFLCALTNDYQGVQPGITEFFSESERAMMAFHGPLVIKWYADNLVLGSAENKHWKMAPELADRVAAFEAGLQQGQQRKAELEEAWTVLEQGLANLANMLVGMRNMIGKLPAEVEALLGNLSKEELPLVARQAAATYIRTSASDYTPEQRTSLMGIAQGAGLPYDAVLLMDVLQDTSGLPAQIQGILVLNPIKGHKILE